MGDILVRVWGFIPARGNSKNMREVCGRPLIDYCIEGALKAKGLENTYCSSDDEDILRHVTKKGVFRFYRSGKVRDPDTPVDDVVRDFLKVQSRPMPQAICLIQPTSPFFDPHDIDVAIHYLNVLPYMNSVQTVCRVPHNSHAWNQRSFDKDGVQFCFPDLRATGYNKQHKPPMWKFGSLVVTRVDALLRGETFFAEPSKGLAIGWKGALDVDTEDDFELMRMILREDEI